MKIKYLFLSILIFVLIQNFSYAQVTDISEEKQQKRADLIKKTNKNIEKYRKGEVKLKFTTADGQPVEKATVNITQQTHDFYFGAIIFELVWNDWSQNEVEKFKSRFDNLFNFTVLPFYWSSYEPQAGHPLWEKNEEIIEWCQANNITPKGHPLGWSHEAGTPEWIYDYSKETAREMYKSRIIKLVSGFKGQVDMWDVVNEGPHTIPWQRALDHDPNTNEGRYSTDVPLDSITPWIEKSHRWAHKANPGAKLIVNDYRQFADEDYRERFYNYIKMMRNHDTPIHGIGIQGHEPRQMWFPPQEVWETLNMYQDFDLPIQITEVTIQSGGNEITGDWRNGTWDEQAQADATEQLYRLCFGHPAVNSINWWGFSDPNAWLKGGGLVDGDLNPKPVYKRLDSLINTEWTTEISQKQINNGTLSFSGFYGKYTIKVTPSDGRTVTYNIHLRENEDNTWEFSLKE